MARSAAKDAGVDPSTIYARRRAHAEFAERWAEALRAHEARVKAEEEAEIAAINAGPSPPSPFRGFAAPSLSRKGRGAGDEELTVSGGKVRRVGHGRWGKEKERIFFEALAGFPNLRMAADAAGVSTNTIRARRLKNRVFAAKIDAVVRSAKPGIDLYLIEQAKKTFDPDELDIGDERPKMTIDQAIKVSQMLGSKTGDGAPSDPFADDRDANGARDMEGVRSRLEATLNRVMQRVRREQLEAGWTYDESHDLMIPPGWVRAEPGEGGGREAG